ncbi:MAG: hypothetical protein AB1792_07610 [Candidatus Zixiibacteriota bacterium]
MKRMLAIVLLSSGMANAQDKPPQPDRWAPLRPLVGRWEGTGSSQAGTSTVSTEFALVLDSQFIRVSNRSVIAPQENTPQGEVHDDVGYISFDRQRDRHVLREFLSEGYVSQYTLDSVATEPMILVFTSEALENAPPGMTARLRYELSGGDTLRSWFELAFPGKDFSCFIQQQLRRTP